MRSLKERAQGIRAFWSTNIPTRRPYSLIAFVVSLAILLLGQRFRPEQRIARPLSESDLGRFQQAPDRREFRELFQNFPAAAARASERLLYLESVPHTAVRWDDTRAITALEHGNPLPHAVVAGASTPIELHRIPLPNGAPLSAWTLAQDAEHSLSPPELTPRVAVDDWIIAVARASGDQTFHKQGVYGGITEERCGTFRYQRVVSTVPLSSAFLGGGLFTLSGKLLGIITTCDDETIVVSASSMAALTGGGISISDELRSAWGATFLNSVEGVLVSSVWSGSLADHAGLRAGDIILQVDSDPVQILSDLRARFSVERAHELSVLRARQTLTLTLSNLHEVNTAEPESAAVAGLTLESHPDRFEVTIKSVEPDSVWNTNGVEPGDVLASINGMPVHTLNAAARALGQTRQKSVTIEIARGDHTAQVVLLHE